MFRGPNKLNELFNPACALLDSLTKFLLYIVSGDLKTYLLSRRSLVDRETVEAEDVAPFKLTQMATDVANGLNYLHSLKYVHR